MAYDKEIEGKKVVVVDEYAVYVHKCPVCGMTFSVVAMILNDEDDYCTEQWSAYPQNPNYCYMCGALIGEDVTEDIQ